MTWRTLGPRVLSLKEKHDLMHIPDQRKRPWRGVTLPLGPSVVLRLRILCSYGFDSRQLFRVALWAPTDLSVGEVFAGVQVKGPEARTQAETGRGGDGS